jgi:hypothetical protein
MTAASQRKKPLRGTKLFTFPRAFEMQEMIFTKN